MVVDFGFEWDPKKSKKTERERGFTFRTATRVFFDPAGFRGPDRIVKGEKRETFVGQVPDLGYLFVAYTWRVRNGKKNCRIISARKIRGNERRRYQSLG